MPLVLARGARTPGGSAALVWPVGCGGCEEIGVVSDARASLFVSYLSLPVALNPSSPFRKRLACKPERGRHTPRSLAAEKKKCPASLRATNQIRRIFLEKKAARFGKKKAGFGNKAARFGNKAARFDNRRLVLEMRQLVLEIRRLVLEMRRFVLVLSCACPRSA